MPDLSYNPPIADPAYPTNQGPLVLLDEAHYNFHTLTGAGRYQPFAQLLRRDGYVVNSLRSTFSSESLVAARILVIANALAAQNETNWSLPTPSAFSASEIAAVRDWVFAGGSLFLMADHMPFPGAASDLAAAFGIRVNNGFAFETNQTQIIMGPIVFRSTDGSLRAHPILKGRTSAEEITAVATFTGQAFEAPPPFQPLLILRTNTMSLMPATAWEFTAQTPRLPVGGWFQGGVRYFGKGRVAFFGEAAMFSAQLSGNSPLGMNHSTAPENYRFLLNVVHWLSGVLLPNTPPTLATRAISQNGFGLSVTTEPGTQLDIEVSADLVDWTPVATLTTQQNSVDWLDPAATNASRRFYRACQQ